jgi:hypothetical protein
MKDQSMSGLQILYATFLVVAITNITVTLYDRSRRAKKCVCDSCGQKTNRENADR